MRMIQRNAMYRAAATVGFILFMAGQGMAITIAQNGESAAVIAIAADAIPAERTAARELQEHLKLATGVELPIRRVDRVDPQAPQILVGPSRRAMALAGEVQWDALGHDGIVMKTSDNALILAGGRPRGTLYAVSTFLEDVVGVRWWTSIERDVPKHEMLKVDRLDVVYVPSLRYREAYYEDVIGKRALHAARLKLNGHMTDIPPRLGGHYTIIGWCHTFYHLIPPDKYFDRHPEWFSEHDGRRTHNWGQLCLTNEAMRRELVRNALEWIRANPQAGIISVSQNDWQGPCQCSDCSEVVREEGSQAGPLIRFINGVAADIAEEYPDFLVETLAYQYTRRPPAKTKPADNVIVRLCSIECDFVNQLSGPTNRAFGDDLRGWSKIAPKLFIWNYVTNFSNYLIPHPNMTPLAEDLRFFVEHNVIGVFEQGDAFNAGIGDFLQLRTWMLAKLLWDPTLDQQTLRKEFLDGYYGAAGVHLGQYLDLIHEAAAKPGFRLGTYHDNTSFVPPEGWRRAVELFDRAERAVADDPVKLHRVRRERLLVDHVGIRHYDFNRRIADVKAKWPGRETDVAFVTSEFDQMVDRWIEAARANGVRNISEGARFDTYAATLRMRGIASVPPNLPVPGDELPDEAYDLQPDGFTLFRPGELSQRVTDERASNHQAVRMPGHHGEWAVQMHIKDGDPFVGEGPWRCYFVVRCEAKQPEGIAFSFGIHDRNSGQNLVRETVNLDRAAGDDYRVYGAAVKELRPGMYFWVAPGGNADGVEAILVDRIYLVRDERVTGKD
jgi:hypothetical protein